MPRHSQGYIPIETPCAEQILRAVPFQTNGNLGSVSAEMVQNPPINQSSLFPLTTMSLGWAPSQKPYGELETMKRPGSMSGMWLSDST